MNIWDNLDFLSRCFVLFRCMGNPRLGPWEPAQKWGVAVPEVLSCLVQLVLFCGLPPASARALCHHVLRGGWDMLLAHLHQPLLLPEYTNTSFWVHRLSSVYATYATHPRRSIEVFIQSYVSRACRAFASSPRTPSAVLGRRRSLRAVPLDFFKSL